MYACSFVWRPWAKDPICYTPLLEINSSYPPSLLILNVVVLFPALTPSELPLSSIIPQNEIHKKGHDIMVLDRVIKTYILDRKSVV
mgnify:CR=1 FL=1